MQTEEEFIRYFWNDKLVKLQELNKKFPLSWEPHDKFLYHLDELAIKNSVSSFGFNNDESGAVYNVTLGNGKKYELKVQLGSTFPNYYIELNLLHENRSEFLTNIFYARLPYTVIDKILKTMNNIDGEYEQKLILYRKEKKLEQLTVGTIKSLLAEKFKNTNYDWEIRDFVNESDVSFVITLFENEYEVSQLIVNKSNLIQRITEWKV